MDDNEMTVKDTQSILVAIKCTTYNHEVYIRQCLDGFVIQQTNFRFVAIVHDDASTDGTADIIREYEEKYPDIIMPIYETENQYSKKDGSLSRIMNEASVATGCKYIAICEGDDYWTDPYKLQKQVDYMELNRTCALSHTAFKIYNERNDEISDYCYRNNSLLSTSALMNTILDNQYRIQTATVLYRRSDYLEIVNNNNFLFRSGYFLMSDTQLWCALINKGHIHCLDDITTVYRVHDDSACRQTKILNKYRFNLSCEEMRICVATQFNLSKMKRILRYFIALIKYLSLDQSYMPQKYNPYPCVVQCARIVTKIPFIRAMVLKYITNN